MTRDEGQSSRWSGTDQVAVWQEPHGYRWTAEHDGRQESGRAGSAEAAHALGMRSVFQRRRSELDDSE